MSDKEVVHKFRGDKQKQSGCLNGIFQIFDHRYRRNDHNHKRLPPGKEKNKITPRNSASSYSSSTATSSLDCSKRVQTEASYSSQSAVSESCSSPFLHRKQTDSFRQSPDIRDVVKDLMTREPRAVSVKTVAKDERVGPMMKHVDSPRPFPHQTHAQYERKRFSCDERESRYRMKSDMKIKELPRLSLDSRQGYFGNSASDPISNKQASSSVVARLMGLEALTPSIDRSKTLKTNSCLNEELVSNAKSSRKEEEIKGIKVSHVLTKVPLETAPWKQEGGGRGPRNPPFKSKEGLPRAERVSRAIYDEIEKRLTEHEFETAGEDLRALKKIIEAIQKPKKRLENKEHALNQRVDQSVKHAEARQDTVARKRLKDPLVRDRRVNGNFPKSSGTMSPKMQRSKNSISGPTYDSSGPKKQPGKQRSILGSTSRHSKTKSMDPLQDSSETKSNDLEVTGTGWAQEVNSPFQPKECLTEQKSTVDHAKHTIEQPSPVSVLDAVYTEETPSPIKKKVTALNDEENLRFKEEQDQYSEFSKMKLEKIKSLVHQIKLLNTNTDDAVNHTVTSPCEGETGDQRYVEEIILASGCLRDLDCTTIIAQLHPTIGFINPELFNALEKTKACTEITDDGNNKKFMRSRLRRKLVFDTVNDVLGHKFVMYDPLGPHKGRILNADKLLKELWSEIDGLQYKSETSVSNEDDEVSQVTHIINADVNKRSQEWDEYCSHVPYLVLDIERLIFKDLICEVVNGQITSLQDWPRRPHCRRLFPV
ncbi:protein LONGIFOLIA 2-like [Bidens hawaiensis]|uniref:protein LONGIFOLIA 2-like n=1 Tax=Bidens hawaiensis TaxID=980011 RepID=UPI0040495EA9